MKNRATARSLSAGTQALERGRESFRQQAWGAAFALLSEAAREAPLAAEDLVELAQAALLIGRDPEGTEALARAHQAFQERGNAQFAARCAFWLGFRALVNGETAQAGGWLSRAGRLLDGHPDCAEKGYLLLPEAYRAVHQGDTTAAYGAFVQAAAIGERFGDKDLATLALQGQGRALIRQGEVARGLTLLDEAMVAVMAGEVSPLTAGGVYCSVLDACGEICDVRRAHEWTSALERWCASQPDLVPYRGNCLVRRAELLQLQGKWTDALEEAQRAWEWLCRPAPQPSAAAALYQVGELYRLTGRFAEAEETYQQASQWQSSHGPGLALLRLAQGQVQAACAAIRRMKEEIQEPGPRARVLDACVEIALANSDLKSARDACDELAEIAARTGIAFLRALSTRASGAVRLAENDAGGALSELRQSWSLWCELHAPYEASRVRTLIAQACRELGDEENAIQELTAAKEMFEQLGATVDLSRAEALLTKERVQTPGPLTQRELEVLRLIASGLTNRGIGKKLFISEKTVARHVSNIFTKLDLYSRAAATAYAYEHKLV
jgi:ATP/maltotriose-dependent transcriptional regulator MalT